MITADLLTEFASVATVLRNEPMARHTTFGIGGPADLYVRATSRTQLTRAVQLAARHTLPCFILGSGSNILVGDRGIRGVVVENRARSIEAPTPVAREQFQLRADSGVNFASLGRRMCREGYQGLEWAIGIPGTLGGAVVYNAGAYGGCLADVLRSIDVVTCSGDLETMPASALALQYRSSQFTRGILTGRVILSVEFSLRQGDQSQLVAHIATLDAKRKAAQPPGQNAGSIFKNPPEKPAWWYIDQVGLRGTRIGGAQISAKHANFFMNTGAAHASDVKALMNEAIRRVFDQFGIRLEAEVSLIGDGFSPEGVEQCIAIP